MNSNLLRSLLDGPRICDATDLFKELMAMQDKGLCELVAPAWQWQITDKGRELLAKLPDKPLTTQNEISFWFSRVDAATGKYMLVCPDCGGEDFGAGPRGGISQNAICRGCHSEFNLCPIFRSERLGEPGKGRSSLYGLTPKSPHTY